MGKVRAIMSLITTKNYIIITDTINDGYVHPQLAHEYLELLLPLTEYLKQAGREYTLSSKEANKL
jgi:hypothetical protein